VDRHEPHQALAISLDASRLTSRQVAPGGAATRLTSLT